MFNLYERLDYLKTRFEAKEDIIREMSDDETVTKEVGSRLTAEITHEFKESVLSEMDEEKAHIEAKAETMRNVSE